MLLAVSAQGVPSLSYNPDDYLEVYPDPRDPEVLQGIALIQSLGGPFSQFDSIRISGWSEGGSGQDQQ